LIENVMSYGGVGWLKTSEYHHMGKRVENCSKNRYMIFERSLNLAAIYVSIVIKTFSIFNVKISAV